MITFNVYKVDNHNPIYGPGYRTVIWFCGCSIHCEGCINPELWTRKKEYEIDINQLLDMVNDNHVTFLGGEPLDQDNILLLIQKLKEKNIDIILFTGYSLNQLNESKLKAAILCDVVISGKYDKTQHDDSLYLMGSKNQIITFNTNKYSKKDFDKLNSKLIKIDDGITSFGRDKRLIDELLVI